MQPVTFLFFIVGATDPTVLRLLWEWQKKKKINNANDLWHFQSIDKEKSFVYMGAVLPTSQ